MKTKLSSKLKLYYSILFFLGCLQINAQVLDAPTAAPNQTPPIGSSAWDKACASSTFNDYWVNFTWSPPLVNSDNEFILELSNSSGSFASAVELARDATKNTNFDFFFQFTIPSNIRGEGYKLRVRSTSPATIGAESVAFSMYFIDVNTGLSLRQQGNPDFGDGTAQVCDGNSITLEVYDLPNANTYQYNWYRSGTPLSEKTSAITVTQDGMYNVEIDYGSCSGSGNTLSNIIDVTTGASLGVAINPPSKSALCSGETLSLEANINNSSLTYSWFKNGVLIPASNSFNYTVDASIPGFEGDYEVEIFGPGTCVERSLPITITNAGSFTVTRINPEDIVVLPGQTEVLSVSTDATSPVYQWFRDGSAIAGATSNSLNINNTEVGEYFARVSLSGGACTSTSIDSETTTVVTPDSFELLIDYASAYSACVNNSIVLEATTILAVDPSGNRIDVTASVLSDFSYAWSHNGSPITGSTSSTISLTDISENGTYSLNGSLSTYNVTSNNLSVQLLVNELLEINSTSLISCGPAEPITITTNTSLTGETFFWTRDGVNIESVSEILSVSTPGIYQLVLDRNGCSLMSNEIVIGTLDPSLITLDPDSDNIVFPEGTNRTISASGGDSYRWFDAQNNEIGNSSSVTISEDGSYFLIATIGNCEVTKNFTAEYLDTFKIPNVITVNGDGINDQWIIPNSYSNKSDINVIIYNNSGQEILNEFNYRNNWPESSMSFPQQNMVFYYKIKDASAVLKQGTITIIR
ncbi:gliding motility-associated C-terminal domain-containing protein [Eudoraea chungangensis]|uniref:T9SS type B sorting domain-containing protein n=1 Tax=Eudoraea chungangensis TaxID=1481905 RepID=UPI0023EB7D93|nr:gliding motility-associated C-terminal domain-containing protein [Eudoraea chungangensis]